MFRVTKNVLGKQKTINAINRKKYSNDANFPAQADVVIIGKLLLLFTASLFLRKALEIHSESS